MKHIQFSRPEFSIDNTDLLEIQSIISNGWVCLSKYTKQLEEYFKKTTGVKYAIACSSATQGLVIAVRAAGWQGKRVCLPAYTWPSTLLALEYNGCTPIWGDVNSNTWLLDEIPQFTLRENPEAILAVDTFGNQFEIETDKLPLIIDAAHGFGLPNLGKRGICEIVSLSFTKLISAGQGGIILTNDRKIYEEALELVKVSAKMLEVSAYIALKEIEKYEEKIKVRNRIINKYREFIKVPYKEQRVPSTTNNSVFSILLEDQKTRDRIAQNFEKNNVEVKIYYQPLFRGLPRTEDVFNRIISLPIYSGIENDVEFICSLINNV